MQIQIINVEAVKKGKFDAIEVNYKNLFDGKVASKPVMQFHGAFEVLKAAQKGEQFNVKAEKDKKGYWIWSEAGPHVGEAPAVVSNKPAPRSTFETPEERARRQVYIIRQSSLSTAVEYMKLTENKKSSPEDVINLANQFASWVLDVAPARVMDFSDMKDDVPV